MTQEIGHISRKARVGGIAVEQLRSVIERLERMEEEKAAIAADIRDIYSEAAGSGFDRKAIRAVLKLRKLDSAEREEQETVLETYLAALGMRPQLEMDLDESDD